MTSTYSSSLRLELMATGDQSGTWGDTTNTNLGTLLEQAITGVLSVAQGDVANLTLTTVNGGSDQARNAVVNVTGALTGNRNVVVQTANKLYLARNSTSGGFTLTFKTATGTGVDVAPGTARWIYSDGTNVVDGQAYAWSSTTTALRPNANDGMALGTTALGWSDLFLATGGVINWNNGNVTATQSANALAFAGVTNGVTFDGAISNTAGGISSSSTAAGTLLTLTSTDAGATSGPNAELYRNSASPAANDILSILYWYGKDSGGAKQEYASTQVTIVDPTAASEDAVSEDYVTVGGARTAFLRRGALASGTADPNAVGLPLGQLSFPAVQNPSFNPNTLDDYEEGSWTPAMTFNGSASGITYGSQFGSYVKIGRFVFVQGGIVLTNNGSGVGAAKITGLPFAETGAGNCGMSPLMTTSGFSSASGIFTFVDNASTTMSLYLPGATAVTAATDTNVTNTAAFFFSAYYFTSD